MKHPAEKSFRRAPWRIAALALVIAALFACAISRAPRPTLPVDGGGTPPPDTAENEPRVSRTEMIEVERPLALVLEVANRPLEAAIQGGNSVPGVVNTRVLTEGAFGAPGSRRLVTLSDSSTLVEQVLTREQTDHSLRFRYVVWNFHGPSAGKAEYGVGEFLYDALPAGRTRIRWKYSFRLNERVFPGVLGPVGRGLFRVGFLDRGFADMMRGVLQGYKQAAESQPMPD